LWRQQSKALAVASIFRARMMNADTIASLPVKVGESLVPAPNDSQDTYGFVHEIVLSLQDVGDAYVRKFSNGDLRVLDPSKMEVISYLSTITPLVVHVKGCLFIYLPG
jgi:phage portal protein BeeE